MKKILFIVLMLTFVLGQDGTVYVSGNDSGAGTLEIYMENSVNVYGFQVGNSRHFGASRLPEQKRHL